MGLLTHPGALVEFVAHGIPAPQGSMTWTPHGVRHANPSALRSWRQAVTAAAVDAMGQRERIASAVTVDALFQFPRPKAHYGSGRNAHQLRPSAPHVPATKPDLDKLLRGLLDAIQGVVLITDAQVVDAHVSKRYGTPGVFVSIDLYHDDGRG